MDAGMVEYKRLEKGQAWEEQVGNIPLQRSQTPEDVAALSPLQTLTI